jgi:tetratricopeptide (TPR) repeat protein
MTEQSSTLLASLKSHLPESNWSWVIPALKHDQIIWGILQDPSFFKTAVDSISDPREWTPAHLVFLKVFGSHPRTIGSQLLQKGEEQLDKNLQSESLTNLENADIEQIALITIGLHNRYKENIRHGIERIVSSSLPLSQEALTIAGILFGISSDQTKLISSLIHPNHSSRFASLVIHALLSNPLPPEELKELLANTLDDFTLSDCTRFLNLLNQYRPELTKELANAWLDLHPISPEKERNNSLGDQLQATTTNLFCAEIYYLAGQNVQSSEFYTHSLDNLNSIQVEVSNQLVAETLQTKNIEQTLSLWTQTSSPPNLKPPARLVINLLRAGRFDDSIALLQQTREPDRSPLRWLINIHQALDNEDFNQARLFAHQVLDWLVDTYKIKPKAIESQVGSRNDTLALLKHLIKLLFDLSMYKETIQAAQIAIQIQPDDPQLFIELSQASRLAGEYYLSIEAAQLAVALNPLNPVFRRQLSASLEAAGQWQQSLPERQAILGHRFVQPEAPAWPTSEDLIAFVNCSLHTDQPDQAIDICKKALELEPTNGKAHAILGETLSAMGEDEQALEHLSLATQLAPHDASPWLSLSNAQIRADQKDKAIETLRTASHAVPDDPSIFLALGQAHLEENAQTQAQAAFSRAYDLVSQPISMVSTNIANNGIGNTTETYARTREQRCEIAMTYGKILEQLGHNDQAIKVYESAYDVYPSYNNLAYKYATALLETGNEKKALAPLAVTIAASPDQPQPYMSYARILLSTEEQPEEAVNALKKALEILDIQQKDDTGKEDDLISTRDTALALLAQAQEASGDLSSSIRTYSQALETKLASNAQWKRKLTIGMGRVALALGQPEMAIAALQDASKGEIQDTSVACILCEAYAAINLTQEAVFAARTAVHLAPDDVEILAWFAERAIELGIISEAIPALTRAAELDPQRTDLIIKLGNVLARLGKIKSARKAYLSTLSSPYALPDNLYQAADGLSDIGDKGSAADCLERALELQPNPPISLINELVSTYKSANKAELALKTVDRGIELEPENITLHTTKANLLVKLGRLQAAQACLEHALILNPDDPQVQLSIADVLRRQGELISSFDHAYEAIKKLEGNSEKAFILAAKGFAAELARATIQDVYLNELLANTPLEETKSFADGTQAENPSLLDYFCLYSESALDREEQIAAAAALNIAYTLDSDHPRVLALQSRLAIRQGDQTSASEAFQTALDKVQRIDLNDKTQYPPSNSLLGVVLAAIELYHWDIGLDLLDKAISSSPKESYLYFQKARLLASRAEFQRLCQMLDIKAHAPGAIALSPRTFRAYEEAINEAVNTLSDDLRVDIPQMIQRWSRRGLIAFQPNLENIQTLEVLPLDPDDQAALILALHQIGDIDAIAELYNSIIANTDPDLICHRILAFYALSMSLLGADQNKINKAQEAILTSVEQNPTESIYHVIHAKLAKITNEVDTSIHAIQTALSIWPDEPRWHSFAAHLAMQNRNPTEAIGHLENAIACEPEFLNHYLELGEVHTNLGNPAQAIEVLKQTVQLAPDQVDSHTALATAHLAKREYSDAIKNADVAISLAPDQISPLLLRAEIALKMNDTNHAKANVDAALRLKADDPGALHLLARTLQQVGDIDRALNIIEKAIPLTSDPLPLLLQRIQLRTGQGSPESILADLQALSAQYPDEPIVLVPLAESLAKAGQLDASIQAAQQALRHRNSHLTLDEQARARHLLGTCLRQLGQLDQAIHQLSEAIRVAPDSLETYLELGKAQEEQRQHALALDTYKKAIDIVPSDARPYYQAGLLLKAGRDYPAAETMLRRAAEIAPEDITFHRQLAALVALNLVHNRQILSSDVNQA